MVTWIGPSARIIEIWLSVCPSWWMLQLALLGFLQWVVCPCFWPHLWPRSSGHIGMQNQFWAMPGKASIQVCWELFSTFHWVAFAKLPRHISRVLRGPFSKGKAMMRSRKHCHTRLVETGAYILVFRVTNFCLHCRFHHKYSYGAPIFACAMKLLALCRWWLETAFVECSMM